MPELPEAPAPPEMVTDGLGGGEVRAALAALAGVAAAVLAGALRPLIMPGSGALTATRPAIATSSSAQPSQARSRSAGRSAAVRVSR